MKTSCPDIEILYKYLNKSLPDYEKIIFESHMADCDACLEALVIARKLYKDKILLQYEPVHKWQVSQEKNTGQFCKKNIRSGKEFIHRINAFMYGFFNSKDLAYARIRSGEDTDNNPYIKIEKKLDQFTISMEIEKIAHNSASMHIGLQSGYSHKDVFSVILTCEDQTYKARKICDGKAFFENLPFKSYYLTLTQNTNEKVSFPFLINEVGLYER